MARHADLALTYRFRSEASWVISSAVRKAVAEAL
jgi:hypothetical protein